MSLEPICGGKFQFSSLNRVIGLAVKIENLPARISVQGHTLILKASFHISLVCTGEIIKKYNISSPNFEQKIISDFCEFSEDHAIDILRYKDFRFAQEGLLKTVIAMCEVSNLYEFYDFMNKKYGLNVKYPPTFVTIYTLESQAGISLHNMDDLERLTESIPNPLGRNL